MDEATREERDRFLAHLQGLVSQSMNASRRETERGRMELLVFSILVTIDGEGGDGDIGPYSLRPQDANGNEGADLASDGGMHHEWATRFCLRDS